MSEGGGGTTTTTASVPKWAKKYPRDLMKQATDILGGYNFQGDQMTAGANPEMQQGWDAATQAAGGQQALLGQGIQSFNAFLGGDNPLLDRRLQDIARLSNRNLQENIMPGLRTGAVQAGQSGSSRQGIAEGIASRGALEQTARSQDELLANAENQRMQAMGMLPTMLQAQLAPASTFGQVGAQKRSFEQSMLDDKLRRQDAELARLQGLGNIQAQIINPQMGQRSDTPAESWKTQDWLQAGAGAGLALFSDAALKQDVVDVGSAKLGGVQVKQWTWKPEAQVLGLSGISFGVLAQDVAKVHPDCVVHNLNGTGYMGVNYKLLATKE